MKLSLKEEALEYLKIISHNQEDYKQIKSSSQNSLDEKLDYNSERNTLKNTLRIVPKSLQ